MLQQFNNSQQKKEVPALLAEKKKRGRSYFCPCPPRHEKGGVTQGLTALPDPRTGGIGQLGCAHPPALAAEAARVFPSISTELAGKL